MESEALTATRQALVAELERMIERRAALDNQIKKLGAIIQELGTLGGGDDWKGASEPIGTPIISLSRIAAIREILSRSGLAMLPRQVRERLRMHGLALPKNSMAPVHLALKRLQARGEVEPVPQPNGKVAYRWISSVDKALEALTREVSKPSR